MRNKWFYFDKKIIWEFLVIFAFFSEPIEYHQYTWIVPLYREENAFFPPGIEMKFLFKCPQLWILQKHPLFPFFVVQNSPHRSTNLPNPIVPPFISRISFIQSLNSVGIFEQPILLYDPHQQIPMINKSNLRVVHLRKLIL